jgi:hypothetical protein
MANFFKKYQAIIFVLLVVALFFSALLSPSIGMIPGLIIVLFGFLAASSMIILKHRESYLQGKNSRSVSVRGACLEITGILLAMVLAGLLGWHLARLATGHIGNDLARVATAIGIGLLVGVGMGLIFRRATSGWLNHQPGE